MYSYALPQKYFWTSKLVIILLLLTMRNHHNNHQNTLSPLEMDICCAHLQKWKEKWKEYV